MIGSIASRVIKLPILCSTLAGAFYPSTLKNIMPELFSVAFGMLIFITTSNGKTNDNIRIVKLNNHFIIDLFNYL
jgi:hypothetical protein